MDIKFISEIEMEDIYLTKLTFDYIRDIHEIYSDAESIKYSGIDLCETYEKTVRCAGSIIFRERYQKGIAIISKETERLIGTITLYDYIEEIEIGILMNKKYRNKGYMYDCLKKIIPCIFDNFSYVEKVYARVYEENVPCKNLLEKLDFKFINKTKYLGGTICNYDRHRK